MARTLKGKSHTWQIGEKPIGSGDAGEVYAVTCLEDPSIEGVMKKPNRIATGGTIQRQANQIAKESLALSRLNGLPKCKAHPPRLLDIAPEYTEGTANFFMVSESASGQDMAHMLTESRQSGKPFPRRVIITVLDALFDLFARAHKAGVLWNDVKLDHIYWHNPTGEVAVIDWGNAQFLDGDNITARQALPRWEDYQQLVNTLGSFLKGSAPELYADLGWEEFEAKELGLPLVSVLARRIAYQQELVGLRVMEYQAMIRVELSEEPSLERLKKIVGYQTRLNEIGAPWDSEAVLEYGKSLILSLLADEDRQAAIKATSIIWELFDERLDLPWHLLREYFRNLDIIAHDALYDLANETINQNWSNALWTLTIIARENRGAEWWEHLVPVLRQKALSSATPRPLEIGRSLLRTIQFDGTANDETLNTVSTMLRNWRRQGEDFQGNPFDYGLQEFIQGQSNLPRRLISEAKSSFAAGQKLLREIIKAWDNMNWDALVEAIQNMTCWDPDRWGLLFLAENVDDFLLWQDKLYEGPLPGIAPSTFFDQIIEKRPPLERVLGSPLWLKALVMMLTNLKEGKPVTDVVTAVKHWCPWLLSFESLYDQVRKPNEDEDLIRETLSHFSNHLKNWSDLEIALDEVGHIAPQYHPDCKRIIKDFQSIGNLNLELSDMASACQHPPHETLEETCQVLINLANWRGTLGEKDYPRALAALDQSELHNWRIIDHTRKITAQWINLIQPLLRSILENSPPPDISEDNKQIQRLIKISTRFQEFFDYWQKIYSTGINTQILGNLVSIADSNRGSFLEWRRSYEHTRDRLMGLLYYYDLNLIRRISDNFLRISQHCRQAQLGFSELQKNNHVSFTTTMLRCERLLIHLSKVEDVLIPAVEDKQFPGWIRRIQIISNAQSPSERRELVLNMSPDHPLYAWLVQSLLAQ